MGKQGKKIIDTNFTGLERVNELIKGYIENDSIPGINYAVITSASTSDKLGFESIIMASLGYRALWPEKVKNGVNTLYDLASLTKVISTALIVLRAQEAGLLRIDDPISKYLKDYPYKDITIKHLLTHSSGLPADLPYKDIVSKGKIKDDIFKLTKEYPTGMDVKYSDIDFILLGFALENIYQKPLNIIAEEQVFGPLNMQSTCYNPDINYCAPTEVLSKNKVIRGKVHDEKARSLGGVAGHAGIFSNLADLSLLSLMLLNDGIIETEAKTSKRYLSKESIDLIFEPAAKGIEDNRSRSVGGWIVGDNSDVINDRNGVISFSGFTGPSIVIDKDSNLAIIILTNRIHISRDAPIVSIRQQLINEIYKKYNKVLTK
ncbi:MAG: serine hydrolase [Bacilli bacterium]|nr:serine hydrolase [Bacilli bacterium]